MTSIDFTLEQQSLISGAGVFRTFIRVAFPLLLPSMVASWLLCFIQSIEIFIIPLLIGVPARIDMLASQIFIDAFGLYPPIYSTAAVASVIMLLIT